MRESKLGGQLDWDSWKMLRRGRDGEHERREDENEEDEDDLP